MPCGGLLAGGQNWIACNDCCGEIDMYRNLRVLILSWFLIVKTLVAQTTGTVRGTVTDPSGALVAQAKVNVSQEGTGLTRFTLTNVDGSFELTALAVCQYSLRVERDGFKKYEVKGLNVTIGHCIVVNPSMRAGLTGKSPISNTLRFEVPNR